MEYVKDRVIKTWQYVGPGQLSLQDALWFASSGYDLKIKNNLSPFSVYGKGEQYIVSTSLIITTETLEQETMFMMRVSSNDWSLLEERIG